MLERWTGARGVRKEFGSHGPPIPNIVHIEKKINYLFQMSRLLIVALLMLILSWFFEKGLNIEPRNVKGRTIYRHAYYLVNTIFGCNGVNMTILSQNWTITEHIKHVSWPLSILLIVLEKYLSYPSDQILQVEFRNHLKYIKPKKVFKSIKFSKANKSSKYCTYLLKWYACMIN